MQQTEIRPQGPGPQRKILFADDEPEILELLSITLEDDERYKVLLAKDGEEALAICQAEHPELVFLDVQMPKKHGIDVCIELRQRADTADTKIIVLTALLQDSVIDRAMAAGADDFMTKPFSPTTLHRKLLEALGLEEAGL